MQGRLGQLGYVWQFITLAGFHTSENLSPAVCCMLTEGCCRRTGSYQVRSRLQ